VHRRRTFVPSYVIRTSDDVRRYVVRRSTKIRTKVHTLVRTSSIIRTYVVRTKQRMSYVRRQYSSNVVRMLYVVTMSYVRTSSVVCRTTSKFHITCVIRPYVRRTYIRIYSYVRTYVPMYVVVVRCTSILLRRRTYVVRSHVVASRRTYLRRTFVCTSTL